MDLPNPKSSESPILFGFGLGRDVPVALWVTLYQNRKAALDRAVEAAFDRAFASGNPAELEALLRLLDDRINEYHDL